MILKELFLKVGFDSIRPHLERFEPEHLDSIYAFREAYDLLCRMEPVEIMEPVEGEEKEVRVGWDGGEIEGEEKMDRCQSSKRGYRLGRRFGWRNRC